MALLRPLAGIFLSILRRCAPSSRPDLDSIRSGCISLRWRKSERLRHGVLLGLFDLPQLLLALALDALRVRLVCVCGRVFRLGVPAQIAPLLPPTDGGFEAVAEVVLSVVGVCDFVPAEVDAASRARLADRRDKIHIGLTGFRMLRVMKKSDRMLVVLIVLSFLQEGERL